MYPSTGNRAVDKIGESWTLPIIGQIKAFEDGEDMEVLGRKKWLDLIPLDLGEGMERREPYSRVPAFRTGLSLYVPRTAWSSLTNSIPSKQQWHSFPPAVRCVSFPPFFSKRIMRFSHLVTESTQPPVNYIYVFILSVWAWMHTCRGTYEKDSGQLVRVSSVLLTCGSWGSNWSDQVWCQVLYPWAIVLAPFNPLWMETTIYPSQLLCLFRKQVFIVWNLCTRAGKMAQQ